MRSSASPAASAGTARQQGNGAPTLIERRHAYEDAHPDVYFKTPQVSESDEWEAWRASEGDADDEKIGAHTSLGALLDYLEAQAR